MEFKSIEFKSMAFKMIDRLKTSTRVVCDVRHITRIAFYGLFAAMLPAVALAQDPPALRTNVANEAAEPPMQKIAAGGLSGGGAGPTMRKMASPMPQNGFYGLLDLRHTMNDYFDESGVRRRRDPALHGKLRIGGKFYHETLDISAGVGGAKLPGSQRAYQKRPDITVDTYPFKGRYFNALIYANAMFPVRQEDLDPTEFADGDRYDRDYRKAIDATVMSVGLAPNLKMDGTFAIGRISATLGADAWTRMYSKPLYIEETSENRSLGLLADRAPQVDKPFEDRAMRYVHQESVALGYAPAMLPKLQMEIAGYSESRYLPRYFKDEASDTWSYSYQPERLSFTRVRLAFDLSASTTVSDELYYFRNGFFAEDRINDQRRYRNIVRLALKL
jgi:hypothetical protein